VADGQIVYALSALKNVGRQAIEHLVDLRVEAGPFKDVADFAKRINPRLINKRAMESLCRAGAFDELNPNRAQMLASVETILATAGSEAQERAVGQTNLFSGAGDDNAIILPTMEPWVSMDLLAQEFTAVGFFLSGHPLDDYQKQLKKLGVVPWAEFSAKIKAGAKAGKLAGTVTYKQERKSRNGNRFAFAGFSDPSGQFETVVFSDILAASRDLMEPRKAVLLTVEAEWDGTEIKLKLNGVKPLDDAALQVETGLRVFLRDETPLPSIATRLEKKGKAPVHLVLMTNGGRQEVEMALTGKYHITPRIKSALKAVPGVWDVQDI